tara:strand:- start:3285 stop:3812 length:528 start_codon:yes stop_codon:yes gene_type:complete
MEDKLHNFFSENEFDFHEPHTGHMKRFENRLQGKKTHRNTSWKWMSVAASIILLVGFGLGSTFNNTQTNTLGSVSAKMQEVETFYVNTINVELKEVEKNRNLETEKIIEDALDRIEELEDSYKAFIKDLNNNGKQLKIINEMINNYQKRLEILQEALDQIELIKNPKILDDEIIS